MNCWSSGAFVVAALSAGCAPTLPLSANWYLTAEGDANAEKKRLYLAVVNRGASKLSISELRVNADEDDAKAGYILTPICPTHPLGLGPGEVYVALLIDYNAKEKPEVAKCGEEGNKVAAPDWPEACVLPSNLKVTIDDKDGLLKPWSVGYRDTIQLSAVLPNALPSTWDGKCGWRPPKSEPADSSGKPAQQ